MSSQLRWKTNNDCPLQNYITYHGGFCTTLENKYKTPTDINGLNKLFELIKSEEIHDQYIIVEETLANIQGTKYNCKKCEDTRINKLLSDRLNEWLSQYLFIPHFYDILLKNQPNEKSKWILFGKPQCPYALNAIRLLQTRNQSISCFDVSLIGYESTLQHLKDHKLPLPDFETTPIIYFNKELIGGCGDLIEYLNKK